MLKYFYYFSRNFNIEFFIMKTILIINDIPFKQYHPLLNKILSYIDNNTINQPVTKFDQLTYLDDPKWQDFEEALIEDDYDFYIISLTLDLPYSEEVKAKMEDWLIDPQCYPVSASLLDEAYYKDKSLQAFIKE